MSANSTIIYILYNANGSILGKVKYGYEKLCAPKDGPSPCAACDLTHGGLRLSESEQWKETEKQIAAKVVKLHLDELDQEVRSQTSLLIGSYIDLHLAPRIHQNQRSLHTCRPGPIEWAALGTSALR